uniref:LIM zinc-binding domain-containing protein n=1 Tax=Paramoeba aestuarina TaxID=180227 RepID=A0A7S4L8V2_9EUKA
MSSAPASPSSSSSSPGPSSPRGTASKAILNHLELNREALAKKGDDRTQKAADWTEKELKRLIGFIKEVGKPDPATKKITTTYGELFAHTENQLEALSGTLKTAKKRKLVSYEAEMLFQGRSNHVVIVLESEDVEGSAELAASPRRSPSPRASPKGFSQESGSNKCVHCGKTVYPLEKVAAGKHNYHKNCFKCHDCEKKLDAKKFCTVQDRVFCKDCYMAEVNLPFPERRKKWDPTKEKRAGQA